MSYVTFRPVSTSILPHSYVRYPVWRLMAYSYTHIDSKSLPHPFKLFRHSPVEIFNIIWTNSMWKIAISLLRTKKSKCKKSANWQIFTRILIFIPFTIGYFLLLVFLSIKFLCRFISTVYLIIQIFIIIITMAVNCQR